MSALKRRLAIHRRISAFAQWNALARKLAGLQALSVPTLGLIQLPSGQCICAGLRAPAVPPTMSGPMNLHAQGRPSEVVDRSRASR
ncbi:Uncharacterised protein [Acinetobacter baumannii]|nr:Uncharacterised protein [Acinetobacter baumannii]